MSNIPEYITIPINRISDFIKQPLKVMELSSAINKKIPLGLSGTYDFYMIEIFGKPFILAGVGNHEEAIPPSVLVKHKDVLMHLTDINPIFVFSKIPSYLFQRYTKKNIDILVGDKHIFLPTLFFVSTRHKLDEATESEKVPPFFQLAVLFHLEKEAIDGLTMRELAKKLKTSYATVNRCVRWMKGKGFVDLEGGKEKRIVFKYQRKQLWDKSLPYFETPVEFLLYTSEENVADKGLVSEQNALAEYTLLNGGPYRIAISKDTYKTLANKEIIKDSFGTAGVEVWKYDPALLSETSVIDKLSLYLLLKDYDDERVQIELDNMMNEIKW